MKIRGILAHWKDISDPNTQVLKYFTLWKRNFVFECYDDDDDQFLAETGAMVSFVSHTKEGHESVHAQSAITRTRSISADTQSDIGSSHDSYDAPVNAPVHALLSKPTFNSTAKRLSVLKSTIDLRADSEGRFLLLAKELEFVRNQSKLSLSHAINTATALAATEGKLSLKQEDSVAESDMKGELRPCLKAHETLQ